MSVDKEREIAALEKSQFGLVGLGQFRGLGLSDDSINRRVRRTRHDSIRRGVLLNVGIETGFEQRVMAALLAAGSVAYASHECAGQLWSSPLPRAAPVEILSAMKLQHRLDGVKCHRSGHLDDRDHTVLNDIPLTTPERTIVDISARFDAKVIGRLIDDALRRKIATLDRFIETAERLGSAPGRSRKKMLVLLSRRDGDVAKRESTLEDFVFDALRRFRMPMPTPQWPIGVNGRKRWIDLCYPDIKLAIEAKGFESHGTRASFDSDALRGNELQLAGFRVLEFTSAFTDWQIATQVAAAVGIDLPTRPSKALTFTEWVRRRNRLCRTPPLAAD
jgi:very-short-patch-repair endonuclease